MPITAAALIDPLEYDADVAALIVHNLSEAEIYADVRLILGVRGIVSKQEIAGDQLSEGLAIISQPQTVSPGMAVSVEAGV